ncbi:hypothetical protein Moror_8175 [Moniliophthora roreri MCA 2997]|uniref:Uncharacterized protein n=1 Tax=Moniliophthora roreri (strain MCA 2997) TaxID=1381753 RepID=V2XPA2_MONRO|nr:hypothetical protein Moror_8175 [Moniliophthora roreri MCA 2997]
MSCSLSAISFASGLPDRRGGVRLQKSGLFFYDHENIPVVNMVDGVGRYLPPCYFWTTLRTDVSNPEDPILWLLVAQGRCLPHSANTAEPHILTVDQEGSAVPSQWQQEHQPQ